MEEKTWYQKIGSILTTKGLAIGTALVVLGGILEGSTGWIDGICQAIKTLLGA